MSPIDTHIQWMEQKPRDLHGRPAASARFRGAHVAGILSGRWEGPVLVVETDHLKAGWMRRNGLMLSDRAHMTERFIRHGDLLTHVYIIEDPVYLTEPLIKTNGFRLTTRHQPAISSVKEAVEVPHDAGEVPHYLPGQNPYVTNSPRSTTSARGRPRRCGDRAPRVRAEDPQVTCPASRASARPPRGRRCRRASHAATHRPLGTPAPAPDGAIAARSGQRLDGQRGVVNVAVQIGDEGVLLVDTGTEAQAAAILTEIRRLAGDKPIRYIVNTHAHPDHTGGNVTVAAAGGSIISGNFAAQAGTAAANAAKIVAHEHTPDSHG